MTNEALVAAFVATVLGVVLRTYLPWMNVKNGNPEATFRKAYGASAVTALLGALGTSLQLWPQILPGVTDDWFLSAFLAFVTAAGLNHFLNELMDKGR